MDPLEFAIAHQRTQHRQRYYVGDNVRLKMGHYGCSWMGNDLNPPGSIRRVVQVYDDYDGRRLTWIQLEMTGPKQNPMHGCVAPAFDQMELHERHPSNIYAYESDCVVLN